MNSAAMGESVSGSCLGMSKQGTGIFSSFVVQYGFGVENVVCRVLTTSCWFEYRVVGSINRSVLTLKWSVFVSWEKCCWVFSPVIPSES